MSASREQGVAPSSAPLHRTPWFLADASRGDSKVLLLDRFEVGLSDADDLSARVNASLDLGFLSPALEPDVLEILLSDQFAAASEYVYGHPFWESIRQGSKRALDAYLLETRHYLAAAASRMAASIAPGLGLHPLTLLLSRHLLEEWDHAKFYSDALAVVGCAPSLTSEARPIPATLEWIHATRAIASKNDLSAAACSGFMEFSSVELDAVTSWHAMLVDTSLLPADANKAIMEHVDTDVGLGHADNWKHALRAHGLITARDAAEVLNDVTTIAEAIYRWLSALRDGASASVVTGIELLTEEDVLATEPPGDAVFDAAIYDGWPVWPADLMATVNAGVDDPIRPSHIVAGLTYSLGHLADQLQMSGRPLAGLIEQQARKLGRVPLPDLASPAALEEVATQWLRSIEGHALWAAMVDEAPRARAPESLAIGYVLENYHYLASAARHIGAAIGSCTNAAVRLQLIEHLEDELEHCDLLREGLIRTGLIDDPDRCRPLSTTVAFVGFLGSVARQDWKAYVLVSAFLQKSLSEIRSSPQLTDFYAKAMAAGSHAKHTLAPLARHDDLDEDLGHDSRPRARLDAMLKVDALPAESLRHAALAPALAWGFLDGILAHYRHGPAALRQRAAWRA